MYNRYIPKEDGSYTRNRIPDHHPPDQSAPPPNPPYFSAKDPQKAAPHSPPGFLKQLIPKGFDTGDLIIILLLLLIAGDCEEDRNNAILTIALYFLM